MTISRNRPRVQAWENSPKDEDIRRDQMP